MTDSKTIKRTELFILSYQLKGLLDGLLHCSSINEPVGVTTRELFKKLHSDFLSKTKGRHTENLPNISEDSNVGDYVCLVSVIYYSVLSFLNPDEVEQQFGSYRIGFKNK